MEVPLAKSSGMGSGKFAGVMEIGRERWSGSFSFFVISVGNLY